MGMIVLCREHYQMAKRVRSRIYPRQRTAIYTPCRGDGLGEMVYFSCIYLPIIEL